MPNEMEVQQSEKYPMTAMSVVAQVRLIQEVMKAVMKKDEHYGVIPGTQKPSLYKAGAEKLLMTFRIAPDPIVEDLSTSDSVRYRVTVKGTSIASGAFLGSGIGEASSDEEKYKWRKAVHEDEFTQTPEDRRRLKFFKDGNTQPQIRTNPADVANTILKMAKKRAYVDLALTTTAASDLFAQDLEDLPEEVREAVVGAEPAREPIKPPQKKEAASSGDVVTFIPAAVSIKKGEGAKGPWTKYGIKAPNDEWYGTFDAEAGELAVLAKDNKTPIRVKFAIDGQYKNAVTVEAA